MKPLFLVLFIGVCAVTLAATFRPSINNPSSTFAGGITSTYKAGVAPTIIGPLTNGGGRTNTNAFNIIMYVQAQTGSSITGLAINNASFTAFVAQNFVTLYMKPNDYATWGVTGVNVTGSIIPQ